MEERRVHKDVPLVTDYQAAAVAQPGEGTLNLPPSAIAPQLAAVLGLGSPAIAAMRADQLYATIGESLPERIGVVGLVGDQSRGLRLCLDRVEGSFRERDFPRRGRGKVASQRKTLAVDHHHPLRALAPLGGSHGFAPPLAGAKLASRKASCQSSVPAAFSCARKARHTSNHTPLSSQNRKRRQQVEGLGYPSGRSAHGAPVRRIHRMPSNTSRLSRHGLPPLGPAAISGSNGPIFAHTSSVRNRLRAMDRASMTKRPCLRQSFQ